MSEIVFESLYLFLPAYAANIAPVLAKRLGAFRLLDRPLDGGKRIGSQPLFGPHKTLRGVVVGICAAVGVATLQRLGVNGTGVLSTLSSLPHAAFSPVLWGAALGGGALLGDLLKSFVKRRLNIPPGRRWFPWDQLDMVLGGLLVGGFLYHFSFPTVLTLVLLTPLLGVLVNIGGYLLSVKEAW